VIRHGISGVPARNRQLDYDQDIGPADDGDRWLLNVQPVIPFSLNDDLKAPVNVSASKLLRFGNQLVSLGGGVRDWLDSPDSGAEGFGLRLTATLPFPR
jgi:hypothetical protein